VGVVGAPLTLVNRRPGAHLARRHGDAVAPGPRAGGAPGAVPRVALLAVLLAPSTAGATDPFEIQVYQPDLNPPGRFGLEVHLNQSLAGRRTGEGPDQIAPHHVGRMTLEPALGLTRWLEVGGYLQGFITPDGETHVGGVKLRAKVVPPRTPGSAFFWGVNVELGRVPATVEAAGWANEFRPFVGWDDGRWLLDVNPIFGYALTGPEAFRPDLEPCGKLGWNTQRGFMLGLEYYTGLGPIGDGPAWSQQEHTLYAAFDLAPPAGGPEPDWELNIGLGRGLTEGSPNAWIAKAIVGRSF